MDIIMIRHGESDDNVSKIFSRDTTKLTEKGKSQIRETKNLLKNYKFDKVYYSPLTRTDETRQHLELEGIEEDRIREINFGIFTGYSFDEFTSIYPDESKLWIENPNTYLVPDGESIDMVYERVKNFLEEVIKLDENVLIVTHEGIIRLICSWVFDEPKHFFRFRANNGSISIVTVDDGYKYIKELNNSHNRD